MLNDLIDRVGGARRVLLALVGLGAAALILAVSRVATAPTMVAAITNVPLQSASELADRLDQAGIKYKLDHGGSEILVAEADLAKARVTLAKDGIPGANRPGLELFDRPTWGWNDFTQRVNYRRALEGELERTIGRMRGVDRAEVHLAISEQSAFRRADERPASASVLLALRQGGTPAPEVVQGIAHLVSSSVDGLAPENVSIHDETGRQWSEPNDGGTVAGLSTRQLRMQQEVEKYLEKKAENLISDMVGPNNARVQVAANINFDRLERTTHAIDPDKQALASEQKAEITPGAQGGAGSTNIANSYENSKSTEVFSSAVGNIKRLTVAVLVNDRRLPPTGPNDTIPHYQARTTEDLARIETLVRSAVGADTTRGDAISVVSLQFETPKVAVSPEVKPDLAMRVQQFQRPALTGVGLVMAFALALMAMRALKAPASPAGAGAQLALAGATSVAGAGAGGMRMTAGSAPALAPPQYANQGALPPVAQSTRVVGGSGSNTRFVFAEANTELRDKVASTVENNPDSAARLVKTWIKDG